ncbi:MAG TPA: hypothetical protein VFW98_08285 [Gemmatimonadaceae bacterium]|nr:hypothetical protein [Gemmatimonadaceae bacterium]
MDTAPALIVPPARPEMPQAAAVAMLAAHGVTGCALLGRRGYYRDTMGVPGVQERGLYDDAILLVTPTAYVTYNANCDPSTSHRGMAVLEAGVWSYRVGIHGLSKPKDKQYLALVQAAPVTVHRDGEGDDTGWFGINIHRGGWHTTGSAGCQTIYPEQWPGFIATVRAEMHRHHLATIPYVLTERGAA